jgi:translation initiation factor 4G
MTMTLPVGSVPPQVQQPMFVTGMQPHGLPQQAMLHQSQGMGFGHPTGHQMGQPQLGGLGVGGLGPQYPQPQQSPAKFGSARKAPTVKITHPDTHEEVRLENVVPAPRTMPNMAAQPQPIPTMPPHMGYYQVHHGSYNHSAMYFPGAANMPLTSTQMSTGSQPPRYPYPVSQPGQPIPYMNPQSIINQAPSGKPVSAPTSHPHADAEIVPPPSTARPTVTITQPVKVEAPKQSKPSEKPADGPHNLKESSIGTGSTALLVPVKKAPAEMSTTLTAESRPDSASAEMKEDLPKRMDSVKEDQKKSYMKDEKKELEQQPQVCLLLLKSFLFDYSLF